MPMAAVTDTDTGIDMYDTNIYSEHGQLRRPLAWSLGLHLAFAGLVVFYTVFVRGMRGTGWGSGGGGEAMGATLVSAVPLPANPTETTNVLATESKGLAKSQSTVQEKEPEAIPIPDKNTKAKIKPAPVKSATQRKPAPEPPESNQIPYGEGGPVSGPYTMSAGGAKGGFGFTGRGGDFGSRDAWYLHGGSRNFTQSWPKSLCY